MPVEAKQVAATQDIEFFAETARARTEGKVGIKAGQPAGKSAVRQAAVRIVDLDGSRNRPRSGRCPC
jgi:hypothetical protein